MDNPEQRNLMTTVTTNQQQSQFSKLADKWFNFVLIALFILILALFIVILGNFSLGKSDGVGMDNLKTCYTKECLGLAAMMKNYQNSSISPCDDFYEHVCGRYFEHQNVDSSLGYFQQKLLVGQIFTIVRKTQKFSSKPKEQLRIFAQKCLDRKSIKNVENFRQLSIDIRNRGGFPFLDPNWDDKKFDLSEMLSKYIEINRNRLGFLSVEPFSLKKSENFSNNLFVSPGPHWIYDRVMPLRNFKKGIGFVVEKMAAIDNRSINWTDFESEFGKLEKLEAEFSKLANFSEDARGSLEDMKTLDDLKKSIPEIDWTTILLSMMRKNQYSKMDQNDFLSKIYVHNCDYFFGKKRELARLATQTPPSVLANYLVFRQILDVSLFFYDQDQPGQRKFWSHPNRDEFCAIQLVDFFPMPSMNIFIESTNYNLENLKIAEKLWAEIQKEFSQMFRRSKSLPPKLKNLTISKLEKITANFGFQEYFEGKGLVEKMYETLDFLESDSPFQIYMKLWRHRTEQLVEHILYDTPLDPVNLQMFSMHAGYQPYHNHFVIMLPFMSFPFVAPEFPAHANYANLAYVIGHEIGHAFDGHHRKLDWNGKINNWWTNWWDEKYRKEERCLIDQYSGYKEKGFEFFMNGNTTRLEIVGDHLGIRTALSAFSRAKLTEKFQLPGMSNYTQNQLFFYNYALQHCDVENPAISRNSLLSMSHPTARFRVNGVLQNIPEFSTAFLCPDTTRMNSTRKCRLFE